jgi:hypothetical protein
LKTRRSNVPIAEMSSLSALTNKSYSNPEAIPTSPSVAQNAATQGRQAVTETVATAMVIMVVADTVIAPLARCSPLFVQNVARKLKCRLSLVKADLCIAEIATTRSD